MNKRRLARPIAFLSIGLAAAAAAIAILAGADIALAGGGGRVIAAPGDARGAGFSAGQAAAVAAVPGVTAVSASMRGRAAVSYQGRSLRAEVAGVDPALPALMDLRLEEGRFILRGDCGDRSRICVITRGIRDALFGGRKPVGEYIGIEGTLFRVAGCVDAAAAEVLMPHTAAQELFGRRGFDRIIAAYAVSPRMRDAGVFVSDRVAGILGLRGEGETAISRAERGVFPPLSGTAAIALAASLFAAAALFLILAAGSRRQP